VSNTIGNSNNCNQAGRPKPIPTMEDGSTKVLRSSSITRSVPVFLTSFIVLHNLIQDLHRSIDRQACFPEVRSRVCLASPHGEG
jgi:hypothetical protein